MTNRPEELIPRSDQAEPAGSAVTVHTMGVHYRWQLPDVVHAQLRLAHDLREDLVALQLDYERDMRAIWSSYPGVAAAEAALEQAQALVDDLLEQVRAQRTRLGSKTVDPALTSQLAAARGEVKRARQARRDSIADVREAATRQRQERTARLRAEEKRLYRRYCQDGDLYWGTYNDVVRHHRTAVARVRRQRAEGRPATLRHHRFDGTGTLTVQLQRVGGMPAVRSPQLLADPAGRYRNVLSLPWVDPQVWEGMSRAERRRAGRVMVRMRVGSLDGVPQWIDIPVQVHRWLPPDADIGIARLTVSRTAARLSARLVITAHVPAAAAASGPVVAVHTGWRQTEGGTRVATWRSTEPIRVPASLEAVMTADATGTTGIIVVPPVISQRLERHAVTASARDESLNAARKELVAWLVEHGPVPYRDGELAADEVRRWRSPARFAALAIAWRDDPPPGDIAEVLEGWRVVDRKLWDAQEHGRRRAVGFRDDLYRQVAATVCAQAGRLVVDDINVTAVAAAGAARTDLPTPVAHSIGRHRAHAAPGRLRDLLTVAARRAGVAVEVVSGRGLSRVHADCGHENPADDRCGTPPVKCEGCGAFYDPDDSATKLMLQTSTG